MPHSPIRDTSDIHIAFPCEICSGTGGHSSISPKGTLLPGSCSYCEEKGYNLVRPQDLTPDQSEKLLQKLTKAKLC